jgi:hypothetical protein
VDNGGTKLCGLSVETVGIVALGRELGAPVETVFGIADKGINGDGDVYAMGVVAVGDDTGNAVGDDDGKSEGGSVDSGGIVSVALTTTVGDCVSGDTVGCSAVDGGTVVGVDVGATGVAVVVTTGIAVIGAMEWGEKFHFGPMYLHPSRPYSVRPGQSVSSPALLAGPLPH